MIYVETQTTKPEMNLAFEEYFLKDDKFTEPVFMLWQNEPTIVVGRFQNTVQEINRTYTSEAGIKVVRRISGGGAVYHDLGNLCYTFIFRGIAPEEVDFSRFAKPVVRALTQLGVTAEISGRNDLTIDGKKFSGTAMSLFRKSLLFHGTLLYDSNLSVLSKALNVSLDKIESKGLKSVKSRVTNIEPYVKGEKDIRLFKEALRQAVKSQENFIEYIPDKQDLEKIEKLAEEKYGSWEWTYGSDNEAQICNAKRFAGGKVEAFVNLSGGKIVSCRFQGDFLGLCDIAEVENMLNGVYYEREAVRRALSCIDVKKFFGQITVEELADCVLGS